MNACEKCADPEGLETVERGLNLFLDQKRWSAGYSEQFGEAAEEIGLPYSVVEEYQLAADAGLEAIRIAEKTLKDAGNIDCLDLGCDLSNFCPKYERVRSALPLLYEITKPGEETGE